MNKIHFLASRLFGLLAILALSMTFTACSDDDDDKDKNPPAIQQAFTDALSVKVMGVSVPQGDATINLDGKNGIYEMTLKNFIFNMGTPMKIGNVKIEGIKGVMNSDGSVSLTAKDIRTTITPGDEDRDWVGPTLAEVGIFASVDGVLKNNKLSATIDMIVPSAENPEQTMPITVLFGAN